MFEITEHVVAFLREYIDSVDQLEILLLLKSKSGSECTAEDISRALSTPTVCLLFFIAAVSLAGCKKHIAAAPPAPPPVQPAPPPPAPTITLQAAPNAIDRG